MTTLTLKQVEAHYPLAAQMMRNHKIRKASLNVQGSIFISEDTRYTLVGPNGETKTVAVGGEWGGISNTEYIGNDYAIPQGFYAISNRIFMGKRMIDVYAPNMPKLT